MEKNECTHAQTIVGGVPARATCIACGATRGKFETEWVFVNNEPDVILEIWLNDAGVPYSIVFIPLSDEEEAARHAKREMKDSIYMFASIGPIS